MEDLCIVCAEPLHFTAYGPCGHKETCSKCVSRLRSVIKDQRCALCQQQVEAVFVTRFMGDYTATVPAEDFPKLTARAKAGELQYLESAQAYFDDQPHFRAITALCSYTHPRVWQDNPELKDKSFASMKALKAHLAASHKLGFCALCLEGRKVFVGEQQLYGRAEIERHLRQGDVDGPMAEGGFKGHPECRFCRKRFYGENELFTHMTSAHEQCFLCRRANPHKHAYFRDYAELEGHFRSDHFPCEHPACLEAKFVVFPSEQALKQHTAREHGGQMTRSEKKAALTVPVNFSYRRGAPEEDGPSSSSSAAAAAAAAGGATVIGGAGSVPSRYGRRGSQHNLQEAAAAQQAIHASVESAQAERAQRESAAPNGSRPPSAQGGQQQQVGRGRAEEPPAMRLSEMDFPAVGQASGAAAAGGTASGRWAGAAGAAAGGLLAADFPALPGTSKGAKKKAKAKKSMAQVLGNPGGAVRVVQSGGAGPSRPPVTVSALDQFPALRQSASAPQLAERPGAAAQAAAANFPALRPLEREEEWQQASSSSSARQQHAAQGAALAAVRQAHPRPPSAAQAAPPKPARAAAPPPAAEAAAAAAAAAGPSGISEALKAANRALIEKIQARLDAGELARFRGTSADWVRGATSSQQYHAAVVELGLAGLVPELAATCPDAGKRAELLDAHRGAFAEGLGSGRGGSRGGGGGGKKWVPPEAAAAAAAHAEAHSSWACDSCTLHNAPGTASCEACGMPKGRAPAEESQWARMRAAPTGAGGSSAPPVAAARVQAPPAATAAGPSSGQDVFPSLPSAAPQGGCSSGAAAAAAGSSAAKGGRQKKKVGLGAFIQEQHQKSHPQNVWRNTNLRGEWAAAPGALAQEQRALEDAWGRR